MQWLSSPWFQRKPVSHLIEEMNSGERLHRRLGPLALMSLGIGATIGTGLYVSTGIVARDIAGPSIMLSFVLAAVGCGFAALCYSELASMVPVAGSAYTYAYATLGELIAWIIGWDLILEYAIGSCFVANGWSSYFDSMLQHVFNVHLDPRLLSPPWYYDFKQEEFVLQFVTLKGGTQALAWFNLPAVLITVAITIILVIGIKESAGFNAAMVLVNIGVVLTVIGVGVAYVDPANWRPFLHEDKQYRGIALGAARIFIAYIGFDSISTHAEEAQAPARPGAGHHGRTRGLYGSLRRGRGRTHRHDPLPADQRGRAPVRGLAGERADFCRGHDYPGHSGRNDQLTSGWQPQPAADLAGHGARRPAAALVLRRRAFPVQDPLEIHDPGRCCGRRGWSPGTARLSRRPGQHRYALRFRDRLRGRLDPADHRPRRAPAVPHAFLRLSSRSWASWSTAA